MITEIEELFRVRKSFSMYTKKAEPRVMLKSMEGLLGNSLGC